MAGNSNDDRSGFMRFARVSTGGILLFITLLRYVGAYLFYVSKHESVTFSAGPDGTDTHLQLVWERTIRYENEAIRFLFVPLEKIDRTIRPQRWEWFEYVTDAQIQSGDFGE